MVTEIANLGKRSVQTTVSLPLYLYIQLLEKAKNEHLSLSEIVRGALFKELERNSVEEDGENKD